MPEPEPQHHTKGGARTQNWENFPFSFPVCLTHSSPFLGAPLRDSPLVQARTSLSHLVVLRIPGGDVASPSPGVEKKVDQSACPIYKTLFRGVKLSFA